MQLGEAKQKALSLMAEYSVDGVLVSDGENADYLNRMNRFADISQKEIAQVKKIHAIYQISHNPIQSQLGLMKGFDLKQHLTDDVIFEYIGSKSYYLEVDNVADVYIEENVNGTWTNLIAINNTIKGKFTAYKGLINASNPSNHIRIRLSGSYPYNYRNVALYEYAFPTADDVPDYVPWVSYDLPDDFMELLKIMYSTETRQYNEMINYKWQGKRTVVLNYYDQGQYDVNYYRYPTSITKDTPDTYEFEVDTEAQELIPFFMAAHALLDENQTMGIQLLNEYQVKLSRLWTQEDFGVTTITANFGV